MTNPYRRMYFPEVSVQLPPTDRDWVLRLRRQREVTTGALQEALHAYADARLTCGSCGGFMELQSLSLEWFNVWLRPLGLGCTSAAPGMSGNLTLRGTQGERRFYWYRIVFS